MKAVQSEICVLADARLTKCLNPGFIYIKLQFSRLEVS